MGVGSYRIEVLPSARKALESVAKPDRHRIEAKISALAATPRPHGVEKLSGAETLYRVRSGDYRIVYEIRDEVLVILVVRIAHRREVYRKLRS